MIESGNKLGIVIIGFKNAHGIARLFQSLSLVEFGEDNDIPLIISIDYSGSNEVEKIAEAFEWTHGKKIVVAHEKNLGLRTHILSCGKYMEEYGFDAIAVLEDDLYVSPATYSFMKNAVAFYKDEDYVAGISLYKHELNILAKEPFLEYEDGGDTFFLQYAQSWGQIWIREKWEQFIEWYENGGYDKMNPSLIPVNVRNWKNSWLKFHIAYCIDQNKYFVYPRTSLTTNFSDVGTHSTYSSTKVQVRLQNDTSKKWVFKRINETSAVYDAFYENIKLAEIIDRPEVCINLYGAKSCKDSTLMLTRKVLPYSILQSWGLCLRPMEANIFNNIPGKDIFLYDTRKRSDGVKNQSHDYRQMDYCLKGTSIVNGKTIKYVIVYLKNALIQKIYKAKKKFKK